MASLIALFLLFNLVSLHVLAGIVVEDGYKVSTVIDGHKLNINPRLVLPRFGSSDFVVLDSASSILYTVSFPISQESAVKRLSGDGVHDYSDGETGLARFNKLGSFAVDLKGNVYVVDTKKNQLKSRVIRKISDSGVTTIAGGYSEKPGREDGPAQNASFSTDFEISFVPEICALLISDHGNKLVRQISLKAEDCASDSKVATGAISIWALGLGLSCLFGFIVGIAVRTFIIPPRGDLSPLCFSETWKHCLILLEKLVLILCFDIKSAVASSSYYALLRRLFWLSLSYLTLMVRVNKAKSPIPRKDKAKSPIPRKESVSLIDSNDISSNSITKSDMYAEQLKDLLTFDGSLDLLSMADKLNQDDDSKEGNHVLSDCHGTIDAMIQANIMGFAEPSKETTQVEGSLLATTSGLVKRRSK